MRPDTPTAKPKIAIVTRDEEGISLQDFLAGRLKTTKRAAKAMIDARVVWVNRKLVWIARHTLKPGDKVAFVVKAGTGAKQSKEGDRAPHIRVLWQDSHYLAVDKPAGILTQGRDSAEELLRKQEGNPSIAAVHRLDRETSGVLLFAKDAEALEAAIAMFRTHRVVKHSPRRSTASAPSPTSSVCAPRPTPPSWPSASRRAAPTRSAATWPASAIPLSATVSTASSRPTTRAYSPSPGRCSTPKSSSSPTPSPPASTSVPTRPSRRTSVPPSSSSPSANAKGRWRAPENGEQRTENGAPLWGDGQYGGQAVLPAVLYVLFVLYVLPRCSLAKTPVRASQMG